MTETEKKPETWRELWASLDAASKRRAVFLMVHLFGAGVILIAAGAGTTAFVLILTGKC